MDLWIVDYKIWHLTFEIQDAGENMAKDFFKSFALSKTSYVGTLRLLITNLILDLTC